MTGIDLVGDSSICLLAARHLPEQEEANENPNEHDMDQSEGVEGMLQSGTRFGIQNLCVSLCELQPSGRLRKASFQGSGLRSQIYKVR